MCLQRLRHCSVHKYFVTAMFKKDSTIALFAQIPSLLCSKNTPPLLCSQTFRHCCSQTFRHCSVYKHSTTALFTNTPPLLCSQTLRHCSVHNNLPPFTIHTAMLQLTSPNVMSTDQITLSSCLLPNFSGKIRGFSA